MNNLQVWHSFSGIYEIFVQLERRLLPQGMSADLKLTGYSKDPIWKMKVWTLVFNQVDNLVQVQVQSGPYLNTYVKISSSFWRATLIDARESVQEKYTDKLTKKPQKQKTSQGGPKTQHPKK